ncbi:CCA tRNA nucleotidyltransferase [Caulobacter sp. 17J80-11]|uniref:CCA tRNA nucleotidyltransferase n=1 Tax=Caulobacter sp. 17J80-11 TaxID=2763502 RepID=UPI001653ABC7|nr:CCA tRNA nucleotidyltransferase [Caulobacter sp. 17J80-11]MBC6982266.1 CCA tRNA nucleotidyltransferase [Caulobacter sp. 17J80-11]
MTAPETRAVLDALEAAGGPDCARFVGGCVRNTLMGRPADDVDIATVLTPRQVIAALERAGLRAVPTGVEHGTVTAIADHHPFEITTLRRDVETDGRRAVVAFSTDWAEDAARRDFRLNALYADREGRLHDYAGGGVEDALAGRIVFVGDAETRIREDYLRILRFFRFFAWYGRGEPDAVGLAACAALAGGIAALSAERISKELLKLLSAPDPRTAVRLMVEAGVWAAAVPVEANLARFEAMVQIDPDPELRLSALLPDDPELDASLAENLRMSNAQRDRLVAALPSGPAVSLDMSEPAARAAIYRLGTRTFTDRVKRAWAEHPKHSEPARALLDLAAHWKTPKFPLGGADAKAAGVPHGPAVGRLLRQTEDWWVEHDFPENGARERLEALAREAAA